MALRKQKLIDVASENQKEEDSQEDEAADDSVCVFAEMSEEEMMDLALRLSEQEASATALRRQQEEEEASDGSLHQSGPLCRAGESSAGDARLVADSGLLSGVSLQLRVSAGSPRLAAGSSSSAICRKTCVRKVV
uniref:Uncharacterized protein n=1 Tax=Astatotilapia calliptera TaxID=8154 RepID=A0AAX7SGT2_ASTCA